MKVKNPLSKAAINDLGSAIVDMQEACRKIALAERAGLNVSAQKAQCDFLRKSMEQIHAVYGMPGHIEVEDAPQ